MPKAIYNRCNNLSPRLQLRIERMIGPKRCFNLVNRLNKWKVYECLATSHLTPYLPDTHIYCDISLLDALYKYQQVFIKPFHGYRGNGVYKLELTPDKRISLAHHCTTAQSIQNQQEMLNDTLKKITANNQYLIQEGLTFILFEQKHFDIRILLQKNIRGKWCVSSMISRIAYYGFFNTGLTSAVMPADKLLMTLFPDNYANMLQHLKSIGLEVAPIVEQLYGHMGELSVDFGITQDGQPKIIEVNGQPQKSIHPYQDYRDIFRNPIHYAHYLTKQ